MARDWEDTDTTLAALRARMETLAPGNRAPFPLAITEQCDPDGNRSFIVDLHVRIPRITEYEVTGEGATLGDAMRRAYLALNAERRIRSQANASNAIFGIDP